MRSSKLLLFSFRPARERQICCPSCPSPECVMCCALLCVPCLSVCHCSLVRKKPKKIREQHVPSELCCPSNYSPTSHPWCKHRPGRHKQQCSKEEQAPKVLVQHTPHPAGASSLALGLHPERSHACCRMWICAWSARLTRRRFRIPVVRISGQYCGGTLQRGWGAGRLHLGREVRVGWDSQPQLPHRRLCAAQRTSRGGNTP